VESESVYRSWSPHIRPDDQLSFGSGVINVKSLINPRGAGVSPEPGQDLVLKLEVVRVVMHQMVRNTVVLEAASRQQHLDQRQDGEDNGVGLGKEGKLRLHNTTGLRTRYL